MPRDQGGGKVRSTDDRGAALEGVSLRPLVVHGDERGRVFEILRSEHVATGFGQVYVSTVAPGKRKGNHFHRRKTEWLCCIEGHVKVGFRHIEDGRTAEFDLAGAEPAVLSVPPLVAHVLRNDTEEEAVIFFYVSEAYDPADSDTFPFDLGALAQRGGA